MKAELKDKWVDALKSGDFKQGTIYLKRNPGDIVKSRPVKATCHCCLGILAEVSDDLEFDSGNTINGLDDYFDLNDLGLLGLSIDEQSVLIEMNDNGSDFEAIALWIEENIETEGENGEKS